ncbi:bola-like protein 2 [Ascobolus immersus RN42]|uniref:Bola-like protein 2 n=1 Tax=Ascobolus immersus RN42 TaxID=1160509 RepID=A0A3N4I504_ASCIM|nr:bola-like protein 2 [Ascobolus immersus RN42]
MSDPTTIEATLKSQLGATHVEILDQSGGCGQIFEAVIVSPEFAGKTTLMRHRLVNTKLKEEINKLHAWTQKCYTPEEWSKQSSK